MHQIDLYSFGTVYLLLFIVLIIMKIAKFNKSKELFIASMMMTMQLILAGYILTYLFENPYPAYTVLYLAVMLCFAFRRIFSRKIPYNRNFKMCIGISFLGAALIVPAFFVTIIIKQNLFNPQYIIPIAGMLIGNAMTGHNLGLKSFQENLSSNRAQMDCLLSLGVHPKKIIMPYLNSALENALFPIMNSMMSMGIVTLPGMVTGQILAGASPLSAIIYQITISIAGCATICLSVFSGLYIGQKFLYNKQMQFNF